MNHALARLEHIRLSGTSVGDASVERVPRATEIDGIRGWASVVVLLYHTFREMLGAAIPALRAPLLAPLFAADLAVSVFFILSGDALSVGFLSAGRSLAAIDRLVIRRYFRLTVPILMSCMLTYGLMKAGLDHHAEAATILGNQPWLGSFLPFRPSALECVKFSLIGVYVAQSRETSYNPFLWTMPIEMIGSMLVFLLCYLWPRLRRPELVCMAVAGALILLGSFFSLFVVGVLFSSWRHRGVFDRLLGNRWYEWVALITIAASLGIYAFELNLDSANSLARRFFVPILAMGLVFAAYTVRRIKRFFSCGLSRFTGFISFPLYLVQFQVLISMMSWLVVTGHARGERLDPAALLWAALASVAAAIVTAWCFAHLERRALEGIDRHVLNVLS